MSRDWLTEWRDWATEKRDAAQERYAYGSASAGRTMERYDALVSALDRAAGSYAQDRDAAEDVAEPEWNNATARRPASGYYCSACGGWLGPDAKSVRAFCPDCGRALRRAGL